MQQFQRVAKNSLAQLKLWSKDEFEGKQKKTRKVYQTAGEPQTEQRSNEGRAEIRRIENQINNMLIDKEVYWK